MALDLEVSVPLIFLQIRIQHQTVLINSREDLCEQSWKGVCLCCFCCQVGMTAKIWTDAQSYCRQNYTDLPTIHNSEQNNQINQILLSGYYIWIGLFLDSWEWSDKWSLFFRHWAAGQPSQRSGDCVGMSKTNSGRWAQYSCDLQSPFICHGSEHLTN
uniref:C-type lectin domain-containing protein n=1 Tax=Cyprinus carpio TaxID=7962 RepID=A0A8C1J2M3_CYPCA